MTQPTDPGQSAGQGAPSGTSGDGTATGTTTEPTGQSTGTTGQPQQTTTVSQAEFDAIKRQLQAADQNRSRAEQELKALRDAQLSADEKVKQDLAEAQAALAKRETELKVAQIQNAFITDNTYDWQDPKAALKLADLSGVTVEGERVIGLKEALKAVADAYPWMIKAKQDGAGTGGGNDANGAPAGATGVGGQGANPGRSGNSREEMAKRFPALRGRVS